MGQGSAATIARLIDLSRGFVVLDDIESIGGNKVDAQFSELTQGLKLSYKKSTAAKIWTDVKTMKVERLNFFGIKMINNTSGVDAILGSRMFVIQTRKHLPQETALWEVTRSLSAEPPTGLRDELQGAENRLQAAVRLREPTEGRENIGGCVRPMWNGSGGVRPSTSKHQS